MKLTIEIPEDRFPETLNAERFRAVAEREMELLASALVRRAWVESRKGKAPVSEGQSKLQV